MRRLIPLLAGLLASLVVAVPVATASSWFGLNDTSVTGGETSATSAARLSRALGASSARISINWDWVQHTNTTPNFSTIDAIYNADIAAGIHPLLTFVGSPSWTWAPGTTCAAGASCIYPPGAAHDSDWQKILSTLALRYPQAAGIEIWNEPNMTWEWASGPDPARYTQLLKLAYTAIKSVNPQMPVIGGALATDLASTATSAAVPLPSFLQAMYAAGAKGSMDGLSIHPYPEATDLFYTFEAISDTLEIRDANGDSAPLWVTETGLARGTFTAAQQGLVDSDLLRALSGYPGIAGTYLSTLVDPKTASAGLGLLSPTLSAYPAFCTVALAAGGTVACPSGVTVPAAGSTQLGRWQAQNLLAYASNAAISYYASHGSYTGISSAALHALDSRLSATAADGTRAGATADPTKIGVYALSPTALLLCNASRADLSYCTGAPHLKGWRWWSSTGSAYNAASVAMHS